MTLSYYLPTTTTTIIKPSSPHQTSPYPQHAAAADVFSGVCFVAVSAVLPVVYSWHHHLQQTNDINEPALQKTSCSLTGSHR